MPAEPTKEETSEEETSEEETEELVLDEVLEVEADDLTDEQRTHLEENKADLTDEELEKYGLEKEPEKPIDPTEVKVETRVKPPKAKKSKPKEGDEEVDPDDEAAIGKIVDKKTAPITQRMQSQQDTIDVDSFIQAKPEYAKYRGVALKYMKDPSYSNIPIHNIMAMVSVNEQQKLGAVKEREAQKKAAATKTPGSQVRKPAGGKIDWSKATPEQLEAKKAEMREQART